MNGLNLHLHMLRHGRRTKTSIACQRLRMPVSVSQSRLSSLLRDQKLVRAILTSRRIDLCLELPYLLL